MHDSLECATGCHIRIAPSPTSSLTAQSRAMRRNVSVVDCNADRRRARIKSIIGNYSACTGSASRKRLACGEEQETSFGNSGTGIWSGSRRSAREERLVTDGSCRRLRVQSALYWGCGARDKSATMRRCTILPRCWTLNLERSWSKRKNYGRVKQLREGRQPNRRATEGSLTADYQRI